MANQKLPLWQYIVEQGHAKARDDAERIIRAGLVRIRGEIADKPGTLIRPDQEILVDAPRPFVSRGGFKLDRAITRFSIDPRDKICADVGASTGGFTDVLLQRGAQRVYAIDVGYGELDWKIRSDPRVQVMERTNARYVEKLAEKVSLVVGDLSFISLQLVLPVIRGWIASKADIVMLVKPQFEAAREQVPEGGVVIDPKVHREVLTATVHATTALHMMVKGLIPSPIRGGAGNKEFLMWAVVDPESPQTNPNELNLLIEAALEEKIDSPNP